ncbi:MAG: hypothetical protein LH467_13565 [Gemmatimonadaceae bacterium]|nr:hypothetical protein [Gemmatimonadaceae bacterium]
MAIDGVLVPIVMFSMIPVVAIGVPIARAYARRLESRPVAAIPSDVSARLERIEQAVDAIAIEMERVSEGQRFTTKLLSERAGLPASSGGS